MIEVLTAVAACLGAVGSVVAAVGVFLVNAKFDRLKGRVDTLETAHNAHVNSPGLHAAGGAR